ncbi:MAG: polysaccharide deacetylase family protein [Kiritimatiellae bacterium]|nr:polysaccharide deacetylase family protein [Kiritimatiellia bacterium]
MQTRGAILAAVQTLFSLPFLRRRLCWHGSRLGRQVAITFDDGPNEHTTLRVLDVLRGRGVKATFFVLGREVAKWPHVVRAVADAGHEIGIHGHDHRPENFLQQLRRCEEQLAALDIRPSVLRPPAGVLRGVEMFRLLWGRRKYPTVLWSFDAHDSMRHEKKWAGARPIYDAIRPGEIILLHDDNPVCLAELPELLQVVADRHLEPVTVSEMLAGSPSHSVRGRWKKLDNE